MTDKFTAILKDAQHLLDDNKPDQAIDVLRIAESNHHPQLCALLAHCYFQRGDTRGDVYSSAYFAKRALELGCTQTDLHAILATAYFRKADYPAAIAAFAEYVSPDSNAQTKYLYGLAYCYNQQKSQALKWLRAALQHDPENAAYVHALAVAEGTDSDAPEVDRWQAQQKAIPPGLGGVHTQRPKNVDSPGKWSALSKLAGYADSAKDFHWLDKSIPCQKQCPAQTDIPAYLTAVYQGNFRAAYEINLRDNVFPAVLGRVCSRPCESDCRHGWDGLGESVAICFSKRSAADWQVNDTPVLMEKLFTDSGKQVAVIGAGPAGLAAARNLALLGHRVTVFEQHAVPGGMMEQGIPEFRLPRELIQREITQITLLGVQILCNVRVGKDISLTELNRDFDAVIMAAGTLRPNLLDIPGQDLPGIVHGLDFLLAANHHTEHAHINETVIVIGGGFTAMDCGRTIKRLGAKLVHLDVPQNSDAWHNVALTQSPTEAQVLYRRSETEMLVTPGEVEELSHEGIKMHYLISPLKYLGKDGHVTGMQFIRNRLGEPDTNGRRRPVPIAGSEFEVAADLILLATGQFPDTAWIDAELKTALVNDQQWLINSDDYATAHPKIFIAGDFSTGAKSLIDAIGHAKQCVREVDEFLMGQKRMQQVAVIEDSPQGPDRIREMDYEPLQYMPTLPLDQRSFKAEVETGYDQQQAVDEAQRCYQCHYKYEIDPDVCIYCNWCIKAKPRPDCIVEISSLNYGDKGEIVGFNRAQGSEDTKLIYINQEDCIRCNACVDACPVDAISVQKVSLAHVRCADVDDSRNSE